MCERQDRGWNEREEVLAQRDLKEPLEQETLVPIPVSEVYQVIYADCVIYFSSQHYAVGDSISIF